MRNDHGRDGPEPHGLTGRAHLVPGHPALERACRDLPRLYSYILSHDEGFSPNPFRGVLTLACCKSAIRRAAAVGDVIVGLTPRVVGTLSPPPQ